MKKLNKYDYIFLAGVILWLIETGMFGWNLEAVNVAEKMFNQISFLLMIYGGICGLAFSMKSEININGNVDIN